MTTRARSGRSRSRWDYPVSTDASDAVDARTLPDDLDELAEVLDTHSVFGRVTPQQKRAVVAALQKRGHVVAMTGDGVNDAMALKDADMGVAMGNGAAATRAVAQVVLLDGKFSHLPDVVAEGRRVIANIERAANLFLVKNVYSLVLALMIIVTGQAYPLAPIELTLISVTTIGIPAFFLALGPNTRRYVPGFLGRVLRFSIPAGLIIAVGGFVGYQVIQRLEPAGGGVAARTVVTLVILVASLWVLTIMARPLAGWKVLLVGAMVALVVVVVLVPPLSVRDLPDGAHSAAGPRRGRHRGGLRRGDRAGHAQRRSGGPHGRAVAAPIAPDVTHSGCPSSQGSVWSLSRSSESRSWGPRSRSEIQPMMSASARP